MPLAARLWWVRLKWRGWQWMHGVPRYAIRYRDVTTTCEWTFPEACKMMRAIPVADTMQILNADGSVHFTLPSRKN